MRSKTRVAIGLQVVGALLAAGLSPAAEAGPKSEKLKGSYDVTAVPVGYYYDEDCGVEDVNFDITEIELPSAGLLEVEASFTGDWDLWLDAEGDPWFAGSWGGQDLTQVDSEGFRAVITKRQTVRVFVCNYLAEPEAHVEWTFRPGDFSAGKLGPDVPLNDRLPVNVVFVGFDEKTKVKKDFVAGLPKTYRPVVRSQSTAAEPKLVGIHHTFDYNLEFATKAYEDKVFDQMRRLSKSATVTRYQRDYNAQPGAQVQIDKNYAISAVAFERWLGENPPPGIDTSEYTTFFINWYGRKDFRFHTFVKSGEPDTDTQFDIGMTHEGHMVAWGGTAANDGEDPAAQTRRVWFYDMSAGPDWRTGNWNLDPAATNYIIPPVWEYGPDAFRQRSELPADLARLTRFVAINLLFTPSPLYPVSITPPEQPIDINLDMNTYEGRRNVDASATELKPKIVAEEISKLLPHTRVSTDSEDIDFDAKAQGCYYSQAGVAQATTAGAWPAYYAPSCYPDRPTYYFYANLFLNNALNLDRALDDEGSDYEAYSFNYAVPGNLHPGFSGQAAPNYLDGTQSFVFVVTSGGLNSALGWGMTDVMIHEYGHHFGVSHPHDGWDSERATGFGAYGDTYFVWAGDESNTVMSYLFNNNDFSQFNYDNMQRWLAAAYFEQTEAIAALIEKEDAGEADGDLARTRALLGRVRAEFAGRDYERAMQVAREAYDFTVAVARRIGVAIEGSEIGRHVEDSVSPHPLPFGSTRAEASAFTDFYGPERPRYDLYLRLTKGR